MKKVLVLAAWLSLWGSACQDSKLETSTQSSADSERKEAPKQPANEKADPPVPVTGIWLNAVVLDESTVNGSTTATIGIASYYKGIKVSDQRQRFVVTLTAAPASSNGISIGQQEVPQGDYDHKVIIQGPNPVQVRNAYDSIMLYVTIFDRSDNSTDSWSSPLKALMGPGMMRKSSSSQSTNVSTGGMPPPPGSPGTP